MLPLPTARAVLLGCALLLEASTAQANLAYYAFDGALDFGAFATETFAGQFSYDDAALTLAGSESVGLSSLSLSFHGANFGLADGESTPTADFQDGVFLGVSYSVTHFDPSFSLYSGLVDTSDATFAYTPSIGNAGYGSVTFTPTPVPLPASGVFLLSGLVSIFGLRRRKTAPMS